MKCRSSRTLLSVTFFLVIGTFTPKYGDAAPQIYEIRNGRSASPDTRCLNCARDCPENLSGGAISSVDEQLPQEYQVQEQPGSVYNAQRSYESEPGPPSYKQEVVHQTYESTPQSYQPYQPAQPYQSPQAYQPPPPPPYQNPSSPPVYGPPVAPTYEPTPPSPPVYQLPVYQPPTTPEQQPPAPAPCYNGPPEPEQPFLYTRPSSSSRYGSRYNTLVPSHSRFNQDPYGQSEYNPHYYPGGSGDGCRCGKFTFEDLDDDDEFIVYDKYNRRSSNGNVARVSRHYNYGLHQDQVLYGNPLNPTSEIYRTYRPYSRQGTRRSTVEDHDSDDNRGRERLYVVYRADAFKGKPSDEEATVIRKVVDYGRQGRIHENSVHNRPEQIYRYEHAHIERPEYRNLNQQQYDNHYYHHPIYSNAYQLSPGQIMDAEGQYLVQEEGDEANNPGMDQTKWTAVPALPGGEFQVDTEFVELDQEEQGVTVQSVDTPKDEVPIIEEIAKNIDTENNPEVPQDNAGKNPDLIEDMEVPQIVTESTNFERLSETTTDGKS